MKITEQHFEIVRILVIVAIPVAIIFFTWVSGLNRKSAAYTFACFAINVGLLAMIAGILFLVWLIHSNAILI